MTTMMRTHRGETGTLERTGQVSYAHLMMPDALRSSLRLAGALVPLYRHHSQPLQPRIMPVAHRAGAVAGAAARAQSGSWIGVR